MIVCSSKGSSVSLFFIVILRDSVHYFLFPSLSLFFYFMYRFSIQPWEPWLSTFSCISSIILSILLYFILMFSPCSCLGLSALWRHLRFVSRVSSCIVPCLVYFVWALCVYLYLFLFVVNCVCSVASLLVCSARFLRFSASSLVHRRCSFCVFPAISMSLWPLFAISFVFCFFFGCYWALSLYLHVTAGFLPVFFLSTIFVCSLSLSNSPCLCVGPCVGFLVSHPLSLYLFGVVCVRFYT